MNFLQIVTVLVAEYYYLRQRLPIILYLLYRYYQNKDNKEAERFTEICVNLIAFAFAYFLTGFVFRIPFTKLIPFNWHYQGVLTWGFFFYFCFKAYLKTGMSQLKAFTLSTLSAVGGGWLYEIPIWHTPAMFMTHNSLFYLNGQIVCLLILAYELKKMNFKLNRYIRLCLAIFLLSSALMFVNVSKLTIYGSWFIRIPAAIFLMSLTTGIDQK